MENLCIDFPVLFVTSWYQQWATSTTTYFSIHHLYQYPATLFKKCNFLQLPDRLSKAARSG